MLPVLHFDPTVETTGTIGAVTVFRNQSLQLHQAGMPEQVRTDLALLERGKVDAIDASGQQPSQVSLAHHRGSRCRSSPSHTGSFSGISPQRFNWDVRRPGANLRLGGTWAGDPPAAQLSVRRFAAAWPFSWRLWWPFSCRRCYVEPLIDWFLLISSKISWRFSWLSFST